MDDRDLQILMKKYLKQWMVKQLDAVKGGNTAQSYLFLDGETLHMILMMLMVHSSPSQLMSSTSVSQDTEGWESLLEDNEKNLKEILDLLND
ncbi:hypothetical protein ACJA3J_09295 [Halobacillus sp. SY10]|uniref:hypothetical protein n=1 Tax=Halobacillus sp. SY10 TaxID=3381356 RepID=UPI00387A0231